MITITIDTTASKKLMDFVSNSEKLLNKAIEKSLRKIGDKAQLDARRFAPVKKGQLRRSIQQKRGNKFIIIGTDLVYAPLHEFGGTITPKKARTLAFKVNGKWVFAKRVVIPKYKGRGYFGPAFEEAKRAAQTIFQKEIESIIS